MNWIILKYINKIFHSLTFHSTAGVTTLGTGPLSSSTLSSFILLWTTPTRCGNIIWAPLPWSSLTRVPTRRVCGAVTWTEVSTCSNQALLANWFLKEYNLAWKIWLLNCPPMTVCWCYCREIKPAGKFNKLLHFELYNIIIILIQSFPLLGLDVISCLHCFLSSAIFSVYFNSISH